MEDLKAIRFVEGTKISHDYKDKDVKTFSYRELIDIKVPAIGIPCRQNKLVVIDIDVADGVNHKQDGREWWTNFISVNTIPFTYAVRTRSGGYHIYFKLPESIDPELFAPPARLSPGVDVKWNGWVAAPPTTGYVVQQGSVETIADLPQCLLDEMARQFKGGKPLEFNNPVGTFEVHKPFTKEQLGNLSKLLEEIQPIATLSYSEWRDGLFSLKTGVQDEALLEELALKWTYNKSYTTGDENKALDIVRRSDIFGNIGPGTIFSLISQIKLREGVPVTKTPFTRNEILERSKVSIKFDDKGGFKVEPSESNVAQLIGAIYDIERLYHDVRQDLFVLDGKVHTEESITNELTPIIQSPSFGLGLEKIKKSTVRGGIDILLAARKVDPHKVWLEKIKWDGVCRIDKFFTTYCGVESKPYIDSVSKNFWLMLAARGINPGVKVDSIVIIEGAEGIRKSSLVQAIGGEYTYTPTSSHIMSDMDDLRKMHQSVIVELPELMGLQGQDSNKVKAFLTVSHDHVRDLFVRRATKRPRGFIMVGTTNNNRYLKADMGERRFWPIRIPNGASIDTDGIKRDREQLFAEAVSRYREGELYYKIEGDSGVRSRIDFDPLIEVLKYQFGTVYGKITGVEVYNRLEGLGYIPKGYYPHVSNRITSAMAVLGFNEMTEGTNVSYYRENSVINDLI